MPSNTNPDTNPDSGPDTAAGDNQAQSSQPPAETKDHGNDFLRGRKPADSTPDTGEDKQGDDKPGEADTVDVDGLKREIEKWKAQARKHEDRAKGNADAAKRLAEIEDAQKTDAQRREEAERKRDDELAALQVELQTYRVTEVRKAAAEKYGLDAKWAKRITSADPAEADKEAKELRADLDALTEQAAPPRADLRQGPRTPAGAPTSANDWFRQMVGRSSG